MADITSNKQASDQAKLRVLKLYSRARCVKSEHVPIFHIKLDIRGKREIGGAFSEASAWISADYELHHKESK